MSSGGHATTSTRSTRHTRRRLTLLLVGLLSAGLLVVGQAEAGRAAATPRAGVASGSTGATVTTPRAVAGATRPTSWW